jgi:hypothetical protein
MANPWESAVILRDKQGAPIPQLWDSSQNKFIPYEGKNKLYGPDGNLISTENPLPVQLSGSIIADAQAVPSRQQNKVEIITLLNAVSVPVYNAEDLLGTTVTADYTPDGASEIYLAVNIDKQPWSVGVKTWTGYSGGEGQRTYPRLKDIAQTFSNLHTYKLALICSELYPIETVDSYEKALRAAYYPEAEGMVRIWNKHATDVATCTVKLIKVWR